MTAPSPDPALAALHKPAPSFAPAYVALYPHLSEIARAHGYALAIHGSLQRDMDLIAVAWSDEAASPRALIESIVERVREAGYSECSSDGPQGKPHSRLAWTIPLGNGAALDVSVAFSAATYGVVPDRRPPPQEQESECVSMFREEVMRTHPNLDQYPVIAAFRAALAREVEAAYTKGYTDCDKRMMKKWRDSYPPMPMEDGS